ncbi:hypothetical protein [Desertivibrio insolitus]|uniref:hypothetical protein n=1 Tax=Herbiconiux sp. SYSU D00978 TaxID=2812562 RepID=UPI001A95C9F1|nr:hypothetical protein [Herbiconiux sp. SYSU D00978]
MSLAGRMLATGIALLVASVALMLADLALLTLATNGTNTPGLLFATGFSQIVRTIAPPLGSALIAAGLVLRYRSS